MFECVHRWGLVPTAIVTAVLAGCAYTAGVPATPTAASTKTSHATSAPKLPTHAPATHPVATRAAAAPSSTTSIDGILGYAECHSTSPTGCPAPAGSLPFTVLVTVRLTTDPVSPKAGERVRVTVVASDPAAVLEPSMYGCPIIQGLPGEPLCPGSSSSCTIDSTLAGFVPPPRPHSRWYYVTVTFPTPGTYGLESFWTAGGCPNYYHGEGYGSLELRVS
jgi:hypothetical protein